MKPTTIQQFFKKFPDDKTCLEHLFDVRFGQGYECSKCSRSAKWYRIAKRPVYSCQWCGYHIHPTVGTPFEASRTSLQLWFYAIYLFTVTRSGVSAKELQRQLGVTYKCAWRMGHEIRKHMGFVDGDPQLRGVIEIDEAFIGGHKVGAQGGSGKAVVFGMLNRNGDVMTKVVPDRKWSTLHPLIAKNISRASTIYSDEHSAYSDLNRRGYKHETVIHSRKEYAHGECHVNTLESYWSRLKLSINGTHVFVSPKHLDKYCSEFEYRFNSRNHPEQMVDELLGTFQKPSKKE